ncbi:MAG: cation:proton antiporter [Opitutales bacterium]
MIPGDLFYEIAAILIIAAAVGFLATRLKQPLIVAFILVGILVGPAAFDLLTAHDELELLAEIGIALLLFVVGLKLDLHLIRNMGLVALITGMGQVIFTSVFGFLIAMALGLAVVPAVYVAVALTFSSTIIIVKLLSDKREIDSLHGRIAIGFLIVQDIAVILAMIGLTALGAGGAGENPILLEVFGIFVKGVLFLIVIGLLMRFVLPPLLNQLARSQELLLLFAIAWAVFLATAGDYLGFSKEVGAFLAGISLASTHYRETIGSRLVSLRDFLLLFFFINLGSTLDMGLLGEQLGPALIFSAFVLIGNPFIVMVIMGLMGYRKRTGFLAGLTVAQISEFSLILGALGMALGHIDRETMGLITLVGLITIGLSTYLILYSYPIYNRLAPFLDVFQRKIPHRESDEEEGADTEKVDVILFGLGRYGRNIARNLLLRGKKVLGVDFDPQAVDQWRSEGQHARYGDAEDPDVFEHLPWSQARWIVNATPGEDTNLILLRALRERDFKGKVVLTATSQEEASRLLRAGADKVLHPFVDAAEQAADSLTATLNKFTHRHPWPVTVAEVRLRLGSRSGGKRISQLDLRSKTGASIVAVDRAGRSFFDPPPDFRLFPGDRVVLLGDEVSLRQGRAFLEEREVDVQGDERFSIDRLAVSRNPEMAGKTLAELNLRQKYGVTVIGIQRGEHKITAPSPQEFLRETDILMVLGNSENISTLQRSDSR